jgi:hypothetical protein
VAAEFDLCWSTVIAASDTHDAFGDAPDNAWVQRCRLGLGHDGVHGSDAGATPATIPRLWLLWFDDQPDHRLAELEPCPVTDGADDTVCTLFAEHGGPHRFAAPKTLLGFGAHYRSDTAIGRNGSRHAGSLATVSDEESVDAPIPVDSPTRADSPGVIDAAVPESGHHHHRGPETPLTEMPLTEMPPTEAGRSHRVQSTDHARVPTVDEALLGVADALSELARALRHRTD